MDTQINIKHFEHPDDEKVLELLKNFGDNSTDGFLRLESADKVFVISESSAHLKIKSSESEGLAFPLGEIEVNGVKYSQYSINESFFNPKP